MLSELWIYLAYFFCLCRVVEGGQIVSDLQLLKSIPYISDTNDMHIIDLEQETSERQIRYLKISFHQSTDFYGRITIYSLKLFGHNV